MRVGPTLRQILSDYPKDVRIVFKQHPLSMHPQAMLAAEAALAAHAQGKFWEMHLELLNNSRSLSRDKVVEIARKIGLDLERFNHDLDTHAYKDLIARQTREVVSIGATGTPASFINGRYLSGAKPYSAFKAVIDEELGWTKSGKRPQFTTGKNVREAQAPRAAAPRRRGPDPAKVYDLPVDDAPVRGSKTAKVRILHYLDYQ